MTPKYEVYSLENFVDDKTYVSLGEKDYKTSVTLILLIMDNWW